MDTTPNTKISLERATPKHTWTLMAWRNQGDYFRYQCRVCFRVVMVDGKDGSQVKELAEKMIADEDSVYGSPCFPPKE